LLKIILSCPQILIRSLKPDKKPKKGKYTASKEQEFVVIHEYGWSLCCKGERAVWPTGFAKGEGK
jgi:hypothetical protein